MYYTQEQIDRANQADLCNHRASSLPVPEMNTAGSGTTA